MAYNYKLIVRYLHKTSQNTYFNVFKKKIFFTSYNYQKYYFYRKT